MAIYQYSHSHTQHKEIEQILPNPKQNVIPTDRNASSQDL